MGMCTTPPTPPTTSSPLSPPTPPQSTRPSTFPCTLSRPTSSPELPTLRPLPSPTWPPPLPLTKSPKPQIQPLGCATQKLPSTRSCLETVLCSEGSFSASLPGLATCIPSISDAGGNRANCTFGDLHDFKQVFVSNCVDSSWHF